MTDLTDERLVEAGTRPDDFDEVSLRPKRFDEYIGQSKAKDNLTVL